ncbi:MAG: lysostaphin resistance A-like protein [Arenimonas sp.]
MKTLFFNINNRLRNGWWMLIFFGFVAATRLVYGPITKGLKQLGTPEQWFEPAAFIFILLATWGCTRLRKEPLSSIGFHLDKRWMKEIFIGTFIGASLILAATGLIWVIGGVRFELDPARSLSTVTYGLYVFLFVALFEETLFRGFVFQRLLDGTGIWIAQIVLALLFALGHWDNPGMEGATKFWASLDLALGAILLGLAYIRTRSLALPVGIHLGWNWAQGYLLGFGVSGMDQSGWFKPVFQGKAEWLTGDNFGPEASIFAVIVDFIFIIMLWQWKGSRKSNANIPVLELRDRVIR